MSSSFIGERPWGKGAVPALTTYCFEVSAPCATGPIDFHGISSSLDVSSYLRKAEGVLADFSDYQRNFTKTQMYYSTSGAILAVKSNELVI